MTIAVVMDEERFSYNVEFHATAQSSNPVILSISDFLHGMNLSKTGPPEEKRYFCVGSIRGIVLTAACHTEGNGRIRLISARKAERKLEVLYNEWLECIG